ncbi:flavin monoamine oxidase family protein [Leptospira idonii]|uniref:FAD-dependent oxidoreductase n=1 Tax=Leptospira idonii TaxID=1193500 RepID=A0A4R9M3P8_9LEPT|nr:NAD(P)/FAD-dependent oxidoreductase [Leptospira idonii]TGN20601.1 FAD-dependent oxidoreductase [Leptospira idonii]
MNRKDFLQKLSWTASASGLLFAQNKSWAVTPSTESKPQNSSSSKKAIVMGAGLSGLYSAYLLKQTGYEVTIIDRSERLGGRIFTYKDKTTGLVQDLGAEWIGEGQSDIKSLVRQLGLELKVSPHVKRFQIRSDEESLIKIAGPSVETLEKVIDLHKSLSESQKQGLDKINFASYARYQGLAEDEVKSISECFRIFFGEDLNQISSEAVLGDLASAESALRPQYYVSGGAEKIISSLAAKLGDSEISLGDPIVKVTQLKNYAQVELASGKIHKAGLVICTLPAAAVLDIKWTPGLPKDLLYSALRMQTGKITKNIIICKKKDAIAPKIINTDTPGQTFYVSGEEAIGENQFLLTSLATGDRAGLLEKGSDSQKKALLKLSLSEIKNADWEEFGESPFVFHSFQKYTGRRGFVSIFPPGSLGTKEVWAEPYERVFFAGEHLAKHNGSMDAAVASAIQAISRT